MNTDEEKIGLEGLILRCLESLEKSKELGDLAGSYRKEKISTTNFRN